MEKINGKIELAYEMDGVKTLLNLEINDYQTFHTACKSFLKQAEFIEKNAIEKKSEEMVKQTFELIGKMFENINNSLEVKPEEKPKEKRGLFGKKNKAETTKKD